MLFNVAMGHGRIFPTRTALDSSPQLYAPALITQQSLIRASLVSF